MSRTFRIIVSFALSKSTGDLPHGNGKEECLDTSVAQSLNDRREQILKGHGENRQMLHQQEDVHPVVFQAKDKTLPDGGGCAVILFFRIQLQAVLGIGLLLFGQPLSVLRKIRNDEDAGDGEEDGDGTVDDEEPGFC